MHLEVNKTMTVEQAHTLAHAVKDNIRGRIPTVTEVSIHVEPYPQNQRK